MSSTATATARVKTEHASKYLQQLCKHWSHKLDVTFDETHGVVPFGQATCTFDASPNALTMRLDAAPDDLARMEEVVAKHLARFAFRETFDVRWVPAPAGE